MPHFALVAAERGERTPSFSIRDGKYNRYSWFQRLATPRVMEHGLAGIVRLEVRAALGLQQAAELANFAASACPISSTAVRDPRAPQNLVRWALEERLRHRLGDVITIRRAIEKRTSRRGDDLKEIGKVLGTVDAQPLDYWVAVPADKLVQLDDVVAVERKLPDGRKVAIYGVVDTMIARHEGAKLESDVFLADEGILPLNHAVKAHVMVTRVEPEILFHHYLATPFVKRKARSGSRHVSSIR